MSRPMLQGSEWTLLGRQAGEPALQEHGTGQCISARLMPRVDPDGIPIEPVIERPGSGLGVNRRPQLSQIQPGRAPGLAQGLPRGAIEKCAI